jgi:uncharacterized protein YhdP
MSPRKRWTFLWTMIPVLVVVSLGVLFVQYFFDPVFYKKIIEDSLTQALGREVSIGGARISLWEGAGITFEDFRIKDRSRTFDLFNSKRLFLKAKLMPLLKKEVQWKRIVLEEPALSLLRDPKGKFNLMDGPLTPEGQKDSHQQLIQTLTTLFGGSLTIKDGHLLITDQSPDGTETRTEVRSFNLQISNVSFRDPFPFRMSGRIGDPKQGGRFSVSGTIRNLHEDLDLSKGNIEAKVEMKEIDTSLFWPYLKQWLPMKTLAGTLHLTGDYQGDLTGVFKATVRMGFKEVVLDWPQVFAYVQTPKWLNLGLEVDCSRTEIKVPNVSIELPEIRVKAKGRVYGIGTGDMGMEAEAQSDPFDLADGRRWIPYRVITPDVSDALYRAEGSGPVQILSVKLSGKMPEIDHCDELRNSHVLSVELKLNGVRIKLPWNLPAFDSLKGNLVFKNGHLNLKKVEGKVFHSTLENVHGSFSELLQTSTLQFESEGRFDLADLPALAKTDLFPQDVSEVLSPIQIQSGKANYRLSVKGVIKSPYRFGHQGSYLLSNTRLTHPQIPFPIQIAEGRINLSSEEFRWSEARVELGNASLLTKGLWKHGEKASPIETDLRGRVELKDLHRLLQSPLFPEEVRSKAREVQTVSGTGQLSFKLKSLSGPSRLSYEGEFVPREVFLQHKGLPFPLVFREGTFSFSSTGVGFAKMRVQFLNSSLFLDGDLNQGKVRLSTNGSLDLRNLSSLSQLSFFPDSIRSQVNAVRETRGEAEISMRWQGGTDDWIKAFKEGQVRMKGVSFSHRRIPLPFSQIEGSILISPEQFQFQRLRGKLGETRIIVSSSIPRASPSSRGFPEIKRRLSVEVASPLLDLDLFLPEKTDPAPTSFEGFREWLMQWETEGQIRADQVKYRGFYYQEFKLEMKTREGKLHIDPLQLKGAGGNFWGEGWFEPGEKGIRFEIKPRVSNMEARAFTRIFSSKAREGRILYSGRVHIDKVHLSGEGEDFQKGMETLNGEMRFEIEHGAIERANLFAKIFSLLNVTQYFKGRLPDLKTKGLPFYRTIAHFQIKDGVFSTEDFLVDSEAIRITGIGKLDLGKNQVDAKIGVHPLVTVDTVLSKIPIAGYILTGKNKAFLSFVYEVKGDLDDPKIEAIPIQSIPGGVFGIIKRLLETPLRPFQIPTSSQKEEKD